jgi:hypothetical protein
MSVLAFASFILFSRRRSLRFSGECGADDGRRCEGHEE